MAIMTGFLPGNPSEALVLLVISMLAWGSWANTTKKTDGWRFEFYYMSFSIGSFVSAVIYQLTLGGISTSSSASFSNLSQALPSQLSYSLLAGVTWNAGNILFIGAVSLAGFTLAFPVSIGLSLVIGSLLSYTISPHGIVWMVFTGLTLVTLAIVFDAWAYRIKAVASGERGASSLVSRGIILSVISGVLIGLFPAFFAVSISYTHPLDSYSYTTLLTLGALGSTFVYVPILMKRPLLSSRSPTRLYYWVNAKGAWHLWALAGGFAWCTGTIMNFIAAPIAGVTISFILGEGSTMIAAIWGILVWKELRSAPMTSWYLVALMFVCFISGILITALATL